MEIPTEVAVKLNKVKTQLEPDYCYKGDKELTGEFVEELELDGATYGLFSQNGSNKHHLTYEDAQECANTFTDERLEQSALKYLSKESVTEFGAYAYYFLLEYRNFTFQHFWAKLKPKYVERLKNFTTTEMLDILVVLAGKDKDNINFSNLATLMLEKVSDEAFAKHYNAYGTSSMAFKKGEKPEFLDKYNHYNFTF